MRSYTKEAIKNKFERLLRRINKDKQLLKMAGVEAVNNVTLKTFLVGRLDTLIFDMVASLEGRPVSQKEREKIIKDLLPEIDSALGG
ncbi:hypothetical protein M1N58_00915 [Dehalococcoidales bacterium]|nr:hypothetical protein [Dehalococcoidales bacterium]